MVPIDTCSENYLQNKMVVPGNFVKLLCFDFWIPIYQYVESRIIYKILLIPVDIFGVFVRSLSYKSRRISNIENFVKL